ncbi:MAG: hypothetical protein EBY16_04070 [Gammaproteobacteria bacterium]|nr:hypothetical protein [Gammaproteobacteria bacterium]
MRRWITNFFKPTISSIPHGKISEDSEEYVYVQKEHSEAVTVDEYVFIENNDDKDRAPLIQVDSTSRPKVHQEQLVNKQSITHRHEIWNKRHPKIYATVVDNAGQTLEIRYVNNDHQLAFWDQKTNTQKIVHRTKIAGELVMPNHQVLNTIK